MTMTKDNYTENDYDRIDAGDEIILSPHNCLKDNS